MWHEVKKISYHLDEIDALKNKHGSGIITLLQNDDGNRILETKIYDTIHRFNVDHIQEDWINWFAEMWARQIKRNIEYGMKLAREEVNSHIDNLFYTLQRRT